MNCQLGRVVGTGSGFSYEDADQNTGEAIAQIAKTHTKEQLERPSVRKDILATVVSQVVSLYSDGCEVEIEVFVRSVFDRHLARIIAEGGFREPTRAEKLARWFKSAF